MLEFTPGYLFLLIVAYGIVASLLFWRVGALQQNLIASYVYVALFAVLLISLGVQNVSRHGAFGLLAIILEAPIAVIVNAPALYFALDGLLSAVGRGVMGYGQMVFRKTYDRASGAEARGEWELAESLYREELQDSPDDLEARRRLAEVLLRLGRTEEAVRQFERVMEKAEDRELRYSTAFRLAEVVADELGDDDTAENLYRLIVQEDPRSRYAGYARSRLGGGDAGEAPTDH